MTDVPLFPPRTVLTEFPLPNEGTDRGFAAPTGNKYRARVQVVNKWAEPSQLTDAPRVPNKMRIVVQVSALLPDDSVQTINGGYRIYDQREFNVGDEEFAKPGFDINTLIMDHISMIVAAAEIGLQNQAEVAGQLSGWGIDFAAPAPDPTVPPAEAEPA